MQTRNLATRQSSMSRQNHHLITTMTASPSYSTTYQRRRNSQNFQTDRLNQLGHMPVSNSIPKCHFGFTNPQLKSLINSTLLYNSNCDDETSSQNFTKEPDGYPSNRTLVSLCIQHASFTRPRRNQLIGHTAD